MPLLTSDEALRTVLQTAHTVAVLGAHPDPGKPAHYVPRYLREHGYRIVPVNPRYTDQQLFGETPRGKVTDLDEPIDVVDVFRRSENLPAHAEEILAMRPLPKVVWLQQGIRHAEVARQLAEAGIDVVQDACMLAVHKRLGLGRAGAG
ncbi:MAG: CoA-binding protein [Trueperaceae bacterium]|nr:CoA-binding protein [Trueperaceae bacterium]